jgi:LPS-assembly protein
MGRFAKAFAALLLAGVSLSAVQAAEPRIEEGVPLLFTADEVSYDRDHGVITARGNVEISQDQQVLRADTVTYNQRQDVLSATGNVSILDPTGDVAFAEYVELTGDLKQGIIRDFRAILSDTSRIAANGARRTNGNITTMTKAVYSPCDLCVDEPSKPPLWQVKAAEVVHNQEKKTVEYKDAWLEVAGWPVIYTPYLSHPDPTVRRQSGFLAPSFGGSSNLGFTVQQPYFWAISPSSDATFTPRYSDKEGPILGGEYRRRGFNSIFNGNASVTQDSNDETRGHIKAKGIYGLDDTWRLGIDANRSTDDTYLRRYGYGDENDTLTSRFYAEGFRAGNYASASSYAFQGLRQTDQPGQTPVVAPYLVYSHFGDLDHYGGRTTMDSNVVALTRSDGTDTRRISTVGAWHRPFTADSGDLLTLTTAVRGQGYSVHRLVRPGEEEFSGTSGRLVPEAAVDWSHPFIRQEGSVAQVFEPLGQFVVSPYGGNPSTIPNEDSRDFEFDDTNLFSMDRFAGVDRVEGGPRVNYGMRWGVLGENGGSTTVLVGQSYRVKSDDTFPEGSGLEDHFSDYVGRVNVQPLGDAYWNLVYRGRWDKNNLENRRSELGTVIGPRTLNFSVDYLMFDRQEGSEFPGREELRTGVSAQLTRYWRSQVSVVQDLDDNGGLRSLQMALTYEDECFAITTRAGRSFYEDRDLKPDDSIVVQLVFKTLGDLQTSLF